MASKSSPFYGAQILPFAFTALLMACEVVPKSDGFKAVTVVKNLDVPVALEFSRTSEQMVVAEKSGVIKLFDTPTSPVARILADLGSSVNSYWDRGLLGMALHPEFPIVPEIYVFYTYDAPMGEIAPVFNDDNNQDYGKNASARLSRLEFDFSQPIPRLVGETVLIHDWCQDFPSHSVGDIKFGPDGYLYASAGDAASFNNADRGQNGNFCGDPANLGGSLRSQQYGLTDARVTMHGAVIRIDPNTGLAAPQNPGAGISDDDQNRRRVIAYGFRNPFRFAVHPNTGFLYLGDVGGGFAEEINEVDPLATEAQNFGWPCYEGYRANSGFSGESVCRNLPQRKTKDPMFAYGHFKNHFPELFNLFPLEDSCTFGGASASGVSIVSNLAHQIYPEEFDGALFAQDYSSKCLWAHLPDATDGYWGDHREVILSPFIGGVDLEQAPDGYLYSVDVTGSVIRIEYGEGSGFQAQEDPRPLQVTLVEPSLSSVSSGTEVRFAGFATDADGIPVPAENFHWTVVVQHCPVLDYCHEHFLRTFSGVTEGSFPAVSEQDHHTIVVRLRVTKDEADGTHVGRAETSFEVAD